MQRLNVFWFASIIMAIGLMSVHTHADINYTTQHSTHFVQSSLHQGDVNISDGLEASFSLQEIEPRVQLLNRFYKALQNIAPIEAPRSRRLISRQAQPLEVWFANFNIAAIFHSFW